MTAKLEALSRVAALLSDRALAPVAAAQARVKQAETRVADIANHRARLTPSGDDPSVAAMLGRQAERLRRLHAVALSDLAKARAALEAAKGHARPALGRKSALKALRDREAARVAALARRRGD